MIISLSSRENAFKNGKSQNSVDQPAYFSYALLTEMSWKIVQAMSFDENGIIWR
jgi:hypothetical protein